MYIYIYYTHIHICLSIYLSVCPSMCLSERHSLHTRQLDKASENTLWPAAEFEWNVFAGF